MTETRLQIDDGEDGRSVHVPLEWFPKLRDAATEDLSEWRLVGRGVGIHWPKLDEDISARGLLLPSRAAAQSA